MKEWNIHLPQGNPVERIRKPSEPQSRDRRLEDGERARLLAELQNNLVMTALVTFAIETGMRRGEIASMQWKHINWTSQTLSIPITKTDIPRTIPLSNKAVATLRGVPGELLLKPRWGADRVLDSESANRNYLVQLAISECLQQLLLVYLRRESDVCDDDCNRLENLRAFAPNQRRFRITFDQENHGERFR